MGAEKGRLSFILSVHVTTPLLVQHLEGLCQHHWEKRPPHREGDSPRFPTMEMPAREGPAEAQVDSVLLSRAKLLMFCFYIIRFLYNAVLNIMLHCVALMLIYLPLLVSAPPDVSCVAPWPLSLLCLRQALCLLQACGNTSPP